MLSKKLIFSKILISTLNQKILCHYKSLKHRNWKLVLAFYFKSLRTAAIFLSFFDRRKKFYLSSEKLRKMTADWPIRSFAKTSPATLALYCLDKSGRLLAAKDNQKQVWKSSEFVSLCSLLSAFIIDLWCPKYNTDYLVKWQVFSCLAIFESHGL